MLLGYPVPFPLRPDIRRKNLEIYEAVTSPRGPAMTWVRSLGGSLAPRSSPAFPHGGSNRFLFEFQPQCMFAVGWMELKDPLRAQVHLSRSFANVTEPFKVSLSSFPPPTASIFSHCGSLRG